VAGENQPLALREKLLNQACLEGQIDDLMTWAVQGVKAHQTKLMIEEVKWPLSEVDLATWRSSAFFWVR
jgi:hypothetical protein